MTKASASAFETLPKRILLDDGMRDGRTLVFENPAAIISCTHPASFDAALKEVEKARHQGKFLAGFVSYEAGYLFEPSLAQRLPQDRDVPLLWFAVFDALDELVGDDRGSYFTAGHEISNPEIGARVDRDTYTRNVERVRNYISAGDIYQANYTYLADVAFNGTPFDLYTALRTAQPVPHGALIEGEDWAVVSLSPELFFKSVNGQAEARPMKGTAARAMTWEDDQQVRENLPHDEKERAENLMILDLIRNDLSKIAAPGSVSVPSRFDIETFRTIHQMTSTVTAEIRPDATAKELFAALFPCGSITGAPKIRAMEILSDLEPDPRGIYTGAIGMFGPDGLAEFNVAIRTLTLAKQDNRAWAGTVGVGGGIVHDSTPQGEWHECELKLSFLKSPKTAKPFELIESLLWTSDAGLHDLDLHLQRLKASAAYFDFAFQRDKIERALADFSEAQCSTRHKLRLLLNEDGKLSLSQTEIPDQQPSEWKFCLADRTVDSRDPHRYHKTTNRTLLDEARERLQRSTGCDEVIFMNERGELTEGSYTNLFVVRGDRWRTPRLDCGLLNGVLRQKLLADPGLGLEEAIMTPDDLKTADRIFLGNSVRGLIAAHPVQASELLVGQ